MNGRVECLYVFGASLKMAFEFVFEFSDPFFKSAFLFSLLKKSFQKILKQYEVSLVLITQEVLLHQLRPQEDVCVTSQTN